MILPGSAKGQYVVPESMHHMQLTPAGLVNPRVQAGDVVLFLACDKLRSLRDSITSFQFRFSPTMHWQVRVHARSVEVAGRQRAPRRVLSVPQQAHRAAQPRSCWL